MRWTTSSVELAGAKELNASTRTHLFKMAESRGECMIINRLPDATTTVAPSILGRPVTLLLLVLSCVAFGVP